MTYVEVLWKKECIHRKRMKTMMTKEFKGSTKIAGFFVALILTLVHYAYAGMHTLYETALFIFNRKAFRANLMKLEISVTPTREFKVDGKNVESEVESDREKYPILNRTLVQ